nr:GGDEF domain-containing protein [Echinimonas agarilytica]
MNERLVQLEKEAQQYQVQLNEQHQKLFIDSLTNIPNRAAFDERYELEFERAKRYDSNLNLAVIDIDHFKKINDTFGHTAGDKTLAALGRLLKKWLRSSDFVARYGGEEFVAILPEISPKDCAIALQQLCDKVAAIPFVYRGEKLQITISIGAASADFSKSRLDLFERADKALYQAKNNGRNQIIAADK